MKTKTILVIAVFLIILSIIMPTANASTNVEFSINSKNGIKAGKEFPTIVRIDNIPEQEQKPSGIKFDLFYDKDVLEVVSIKKKDTLNGTFEINKNYPDEGRIRMGFATIGGLQKSGELYEIKFKAKEKLTKKVAQFNEQKGKWLNIYSASDRYNYAMEVLEKLDSKQWKVDDALEQLEQIMNKNNLTIAQMEEINKVKQKINAIGTVDLSKESQIAEARKSYNALTSEQKELISADTLKVLIDAEKKIVSLKAEKKIQEEFIQKQKEIIECLEKHISEITDIISGV